ncbi:hypothetical protein [Streptomyces telluris]|uniref:Integral membrane protein n=1 Tax=Streptomyces telluris TaxID=2720021 RepID=A0A9X2RLY4_9ACTN|nr:hypothetical protein [Streptomyces telluris]MCQ8771328.1 hypothetical protein [Streptomyces telluris]NJP80068.1 hypothetical protein [Streptomyces telluris]
MPVVWVAVAVGVVQLLVVPLRLPLGWDEAVYVSQVSPRVPAAYFSAPRARGISWLAAPAVLLSASVVVLRTWMVALATAGLLAAFWPWRRLVGEAVTAAAAAVFAGLWVVQFYAGEVMPNLYVAYGATAATGWFLRAVSAPTPAPAPAAAPAAVAAARPGPRGAWAGVAVSVAFTALMRPPDAVFLALALLAAVAAVPSWRRWRPAAAVVGGLAAGLVPWLAEAYTDFGGPVARLRDGSGVQGGMGWTNTLGMHLRALNGPLLCRPCHIPWDYPLLSLWWLATPVVAVASLALVLTRRTRRRHGDRTATSVGRGMPRVAVIALPLACAAAMSLQYLFLLDYAAPRFLIPAYALLAIPVAACAVALLRGARRRWRPVVAVVLGTAFALHLTSQYLVLQRRVGDQVRLRADTLQAAERLHRAGLSPPCTLVGPEIVSVAFHAGCSSEALTGNNTSTNVDELLQRARSEPVATAARVPGAPGFARGWTPCVLRMPDGADWYLYLAPSPRVTGSCG